tara:strand:- start:1269 stop:2066 length:798 start_codon:yes stop_codon:yes gene_type:complete
MKNFPKTDSLLIEYSNGWVTIWFNQIKNRNAITNNIVDELFSIFNFLNDDREVRGITLRGKGGIFCAGVDLKSLKKMTDTSKNAKSLAFEMSIRIGELFKVINSAPQIVVAVTEGAAIAGGFGIACSADLILTMPETKFSLSETRIGLTPAQISPYVINRLGYSLARKMMLLGARIDGREAMKIGIADYIANDSNLEEILDSIKEQVFKCSPNAIAITKRVLTVNEYIDPQKAANLFSDCVVSDEGQEGINSFFEKRKPFWIMEK